jgi:hypothetical protein
LEVPDTTFFAQSANSNLFLQKLSRSAQAKCDMLIKKRIEPTRALRQRTIKRIDANPSTLFRQLNLPFLYLLCAKNRAGGFHPALF